MLCQMIVTSKALKKFGNVYLFYVKKKRYKGDDFVLPECYGVKETGEILNMDGVINNLNEIGIG